jgi:hypothetical protein
VRRYEYSRGRARSRAVPSRGMAPNDLLSSNIASQMIPLLASDADYEGRVRMDFTTTRYVDAVNNSSHGMPYDQGPQP